MTNLNPTEGNPTTIMGVTKVLIATVGTVATNPSQGADTVVRGATPKDMEVGEEINVFPHSLSFWLGMLR